MTDADELRAWMEDGDRLLARNLSRVPATVLALLDDRDRLAAENARLLAALEHAAYAFHSAHLGLGECCCPAHKIAADALTRKES